MSWRRVQRAGDQQRGGCAERARFEQLDRVDDEILPQNGNRHGRGDLTQIIQAAAEALGLRQHGDRGGTTGDVSRRALRRVQIGRELPLGRRPALDFGDDREGSGGVVDPDATVPVWAASAAANSGGAGATLALRSIAARRGCSASTRRTAAATSDPSVPDGGDHALETCTSGLVRLTWASDIVRAIGRRANAVPRSAMALTKRQREILNFLGTYSES